MKKLLCVSLIALSVASAASATSNNNAEKTGFYVLGDVGAGFYPNLETNATLVGGVGVGYKFSEMFRADITAQYRSLKSESPTNGINVELNNYAFLINGYLDITNNTSITPYLTTGIGAMRFKINTETSSLSVTNTTIEITESSETSNVVLPCWNTGFGARMKVSNNVDIDLGYRYTNLLLPKSIGDISNILASHQILIGAAYNF